jgi:hypothetical protein
VPVRIVVAAHLSGVDPRIRRCFNSATAFVTPYAASACDEYYAESSRAYWGEHSNDAHSLWPRATRERLQQFDPAMFLIVQEIFEKTIPELACDIRARKALAV